jgi:hypothetical protein
MWSRAKVSYSLEPRYSDERSSPSRLSHNCVYFIWPSRELKFHKQKRDDITDMAKLRNFSLWRWLSPSWWLRQQAPPKRRCTSTRLQVATVRKTTIFIFAAVRGWSLSFALYLTTLSCWKLILTEIPRNSCVIYVNINLYFRLLYGNVGIRMKVTLIVLHRASCLAVLLNSVRAIHYRKKLVLKEVGSDHYDNEILFWNGRHRDQNKSNSRNFQFTVHVSLHSKCIRSSMKHFISTRVHLGSLKRGCFCGRWLVMFFRLFCLLETLKSKVL